MKISFSAVTALLLLNETRAFTTSPLRRVSSTVLSSTATKEKLLETDVSIPYDAAARLAYDDWRETYNKGSFDATRFESFKNNYKVLTVANISAAKKARDAGDEEPKKMELNEFADMSYEEFESMTNGADESNDESDVSVLETAMAESAAQDVASTSLEEAAAALAEEEQVRGTALLNTTGIL